MSSFVADPRCEWRGCNKCAEQPELGMFAAIWRLNARMLSANAGIKKGHNFGSTFIHWPLNSQPVFYWYKPYLLKWCKIYCAGNPFIWAVALLGSIILVLLLCLDCAHSLLRSARLSETWGVICQQSRRRLPLLGGACPPSGLGGGVYTFGLTPAARCNGWLLVCGYAMAWLPFAKVTRVAFLYHYIPALLLTFLGAAVACDALAALLCAPPSTQTQRAFLPNGLSPQISPQQLTSGAGSTCRRISVTLLIALMAFTTHHFLPLYLGWPMDIDEQREAVRQLELNKLWADLLTT